MYPRVVTLTLATCLASTLIACGGGSSGGGSATEPPATGEVLRVLSPLGTETPCPNLQFSTLSASVGDTLSVSGIPVSMSAPGLRIIAADNPDIVTPAFFQMREGNEDWQFQLPMHPATPLEGGQVLIEIGDGSNHCPSQSFTIAALPDAPADYAQRVQSALTSWVEAAASQLGFDPDQLRNADTSQLDGMAAVMRMLLDMASDPSAPGSIKALADDAAADPDELLERFLLSLNLEQRLLEDAALLNQTTPAVQSLYQPGEPVPRAITRNDEGPVYRNGGNCSGGFQFPGATKPDITSIFDLAPAMKAAKSRTIKAVAAHSATATNYAGTAQWNKAAPVGNILFVVSTVEEALNAAQPQVFSQFIVTGDTQLTEDRLASNPAEWKAEIAAKGVDFNLERAAAQTIIQGLGLIPGPVGTALSATTFAYSNEVNAEIDRVTKDSCFRVKAPEYGPFDATYEDFTEAEVIGNAISLVDHHRYLPSDLGAATLEVKIKGEAFGTDSSAKKPLTVNVNPQILSLLPSTARIADAGDPVEIAATIANSEAEPANFAVDVVGGTSRGEVTQLRIENDFLIATIKPTTDREKYPVQVRFTSQNRTLPEGAERFKLADIEIDLGVTLTPEDAPCLTAGDAVPLTAELKGFDEQEQEVVFSATGGSLTGETPLTATWIAPQTSGEYVVTATAKFDSEVKDESRFTVADNCLRKIWYPNGGFAIDNNGTYSSEGADCPQASKGDDQSVTFSDTDIPEPPLLPAATEFWNVRSETQSARFTHNSSRHVVDNKGNDNAADDSCSGITLSGLMDADVVYEGRADGTLAVSVDATLETTCERYSNGDIECSAGGGGIALGGFFYQDIDRETTVTLSGRLSCSGLEGNIGTGLAPINILVQRYENGQTPYDYSNEGNTSIKTTEGQYRSPQLFAGSCKPEQGDSSTPFQVEFVLDAPADQGATDLIVYTIAGAVQVAPAYAPSINEPPSGFPTEPAPGQYRSAGKVELEVKLE